MGTDKAYKEVEYLIAQVRQIRRKRMPDYENAISSAWEEGLKAIVRALAETDDRRCSICGALREEPHKDKENKPPQLEIGDIVRLSSGEIAEITFVDPKNYSDGRWATIFTSTGRSLNVNFSELTLLFPTHLVPKELRGEGYVYECRPMGDIVELVGGHVGMVTSFDFAKIERHPINVLTWYPEEEEGRLTNTHRRPEEIIKKLWPCT